MSIGVLFYDNTKIWQKHGFAKSSKDLLEDITKPGFLIRIQAEKVFNHGILEFI